MHSYTGCIHGIHHGIWCILHCGERYGISLKWKHFKIRECYIIDAKIRLLSDWFQYIGSLWQHIWLVYFEWHFRFQFQISYSNKNELMFARDKRLCLLRVPTLNVKQLWYCGSIFTSFKNIMKGWYFYKTDLMLKMFVQNTSSFHFTIFLFLHFA